VSELPNTLSAEYFHIVSHTMPSTKQAWHELGRTKRGEQLIVSRRQLFAHQQSQLDGIWTGWRNAPHKP